MVTVRFVTAIFVAFAVCIAPAGAERPIVDLHRLDAYFALFAGDSNVPWKPTTVRLDTYSSAPVAFSVYQVDPADVLTAGSNSRPRAVSTAGRRSVASFTFSPPGGYEFQSNEVDVQLGSREGFFVVEARRGDVGEQVWINRSRVGLLSKTTPSGLLLYGTDLGTGMPLARMRVQFVVNTTFSTMLTDGDGIVRWSRWPRPVFALAQWGDSYAFLSLFPQPPFPSAIVGIRTDSAVVHAGGVVRVVGFARTRQRGVLRAANGSVVVTLRSGSGTIAQRQTALDGAGAFETSFTVPENAPAGDYALLAQAAGGVGGATVHVDANAGDLSLDLGTACNGVCDYRQDVPLTVHASRGDTDVHVTVVRSPHVYSGDSNDDAPWATTPWLDETVHVDGAGNAAIAIPHPNDELASTYGVRAEAGGATADTRIVVPTAAHTVRVVVDRPEQSLGTPIDFDVYADELDGRPLRDRLARSRQFGSAAAPCARCRRPRPRQLRIAAARHESRHRFGGPRRKSGRRSAGSSGPASRDRNRRRPQRGGANLAGQRPLSGGRRRRRGSRSAGRAGPSARDARERIRRADEPRTHLGRSRGRAPARGERAG